MLVACHTGLQELLLGDDLFAKMGFSFSDFLKFNVARLEGLVLAAEDESPADETQYVRRTKIRPVVMPNLPPPEPESREPHEVADDVVFEIGTNSLSDLSAAPKTNVRPRCGKWVACRARRLLALAG